MVYGLTVVMALTLTLLQSTRINTACTRVQYFVSLASKCRIIDWMSGIPVHRQQLWRKRCVFRISKIKDLARDLERCCAWRKHEGEAVSLKLVVYESRIVGAYNRNQGLGARPCEKPVSTHRASLGYCNCQSLLYDDMVSKQQKEYTLEEVAQVRL
jgi:hypothetical protein